MIELFYWYYSYVCTMYNVPCVVVPAVVVVIVGGAGHMNYTNPF